MEVIIDMVGVSLPTYDYSVHKAYLISIPVNISVGDGVTGIDIAILIRRLGRLALPLSNGILIRFILDYG